MKIGMQNVTSQSHYPVNFHNFLEHGMEIDFKVNEFAGVNIPNPAVQRNVAVDYGPLRIGCFYNVYALFLHIEFDKPAVFLLLIGNLFQFVAMNPVNIADSP
jgi:hypothetical protein